MGQPSQLYSRMTQLGYKLLTQFGFDAAIQVKVGEVFNPVTGAIDQPARYMVFPCKAVYSESVSGAGGPVTTTEGKTLVRKRSKRVLLDALLLSISPTTDDLFQDENGNLFEIVQVESTNPGGPVVLWQVSVVK